MADYPNLQHTQCTTQAFGTLKVNAQDFLMLPFFKLGILPAKVVGKRFTRMYSHTPLPQARVSDIDGGDSGVCQESNGGDTRQQELPC